MNPGKKLDCIEESLLDKIVSCAHEKQSTLVGDLISSSDFGSQATLHGRLKHLSVWATLKWPLSATRKFPSVLKKQPKLLKRNGVFVAQ